MSLTRTQRGSQEQHFKPMQRDRQRPHVPTLQIDNYQQHDPQSTQPPPNRLEESQGHGSESNRTRSSTQQAVHRRTKRVDDQAKKLIVYFAGACCALMWTIVILGGVLVLIVYFVFRPKSPLLDIQSATLNAAYLDTGTLLNADVTILANFSNPNRKVHVAFSYMQVDLYFLGTPVATQAVEPFAERPGESTLKSLHMIASEVPLPPKAAEEWQRGTSEEGVALELAGRFRTRSDFGKWLHFTYWLYGRCTIVIGAPPNGVLLSSRCRTKR